MSKLFQTEDWIDYTFEFEGLIDQLWANYYGYVEDSWFWEKPCELE